VILGKTTLIRHVSEYLLPDFPKHLRVVHVAQHADVASEGCVLEHVVHSDEEKAYLESEQDRLLAVLEGDDDGEIDETADVDAINSELERLAQRLEDIDARRAENRAAAILSGLGFTPVMQQSKISSLSGGWRQRVALACALFVAPDILLLGQSECTGPATGRLDASAQGELLVASGPADARQAHRGGHTRTAGGQGVPIPVASG